MWYLKPEIEPEWDYQVLLQRNAAIMDQQRATTTAQTVPNTAQNIAEAPKASPNNPKNHIWNSLIAMGATTMSGGGAGLGLKAIPRVSQTPNVGAMPQGARVVLQGNAAAPVPLVPRNSATGGSDLIATGAANAAAPPKASKHRGTTIKPKH